VAGSALSKVAKAAPAKSSTFSLAASRVVGANDRIGIGHIGIGGQGNAHLQTLKGSRQDLNHMSVAVCDVYQRRLDAAQKGTDNPSAKAYLHYGDLLNDPNVDVVWIATPEHWHARQATDAIHAGKDVYLEKPFTRYLDEAIALYKTVKSSDRILQVGSQGCSDSKWHTAHTVVDRIGHKVWSQASYCRNNPNGEWNYPIDAGAGPDNIDWNLWLGPAPKRPFNKDRYFRWRKYWDYSTGILNDLFPHKLLPFMVAMGVEWPSRVSCNGGIFMDTDHDQPKREVADTTTMVVDYPSGHTIFVVGSTINETGLTEMIRGNKANLIFGGNGVEIRPEQPYADEIDVATIPLIETEDIGPGESIDRHERNFLRCVRSRKQPNCPVDLAAPVQVALAMAEMAYKTNREVRFDPKRMKVIS
jgi:predicted dehydrogenase